MFNKYERNQYLATFCVNIITVSYGATVGWTSPNIPILQSSTNHPIKSGPLTVDESSWVGSIMCIGGFCGTIIFGYFSNWLGRKRSLCILALPQLFNCLLLLCTQNIYYLLASRFFGGFVGGGVFVLIPLYIAEISDAKIRGCLSSKLIMSSNVGILLIFIIGDLLPYSIVPLVLGVLPIIFFAGVIFLPETPFFLMNSKKESEAESSWRFFHGLKQDSDSMSAESKMELKKLKSNTDEEVDDEVKVEWRDFISPVTIRAFIIGLVLICLSQFSGCFAMLTYTASIFKESGANLSPNVSAIIVGIIQLVGSYLSSVLVDRAGRKILLVSSCVGTGLGLIIMGIHNYLKVIGYDVSTFGWVPIASFSFLIFVANCGLLNLPFVIISEVIPEKIRDSVSTVCMAIMWIMAFLALKYFPILTKILTMYGSLFLFSSCCFLGALFTIIFVPETKGKSFDEIMKLLQKK